MPTNTPIRGDDVNMTCMTSPSGLATSFVWYKEEALIAGFNLDYYTIHDVQSVHGGIYTCMASNSFNSKSGSTVLDVRCMLI